MIPITKRDVVAGMAWMRPHKRLCLRLWTLLGTSTTSVTSTTTTPMRSTTRWGAWWASIVSLYDDTKSTLEGGWIEFFIFKRVYWENWIGKISIKEIEIRFWWKLNSQSINNHFTQWIHIHKNILRKLKNKGKKNTEFYRGSPFSSSIRVHPLFVIENASITIFHYNGNVYKCMITKISSIP